MFKTLKSFKKRQKAILGVWIAVCAVILAVVIWLNCFAASYDQILRQHFGVIGESTSGSGENTYTSDYSDMDAAEAAISELNKEIVSEGTVLIKNNNDALPLSKGSSISVFGMSSVLWLTLDRVKTTKDSVFADALEDYGFTMNTELRKFYKTSTHTNWGQGDPKGSGDGEGDWTIDEVPQSEYTDAVKNSYSLYNDAAIIVISRSCGEGADLPRSMDRFGGTDDEHYLELTQDEKDLFEAVGKAGFKKVIVVLHMDNAFELSFLNDYDFIDSVLWVSGTGEDGVQALPAIFAGDVSPSGRLVDTYVYDNLSSPAMQNFGDYRYVDADGNLTGYSYVNYAEGIYVGYRYYETRYEDYVLGADNVGEYDYSTTVAAAFGSGLSYTSFEWDNFECKYNASTDCYDITLDVKNTGDIASKDVVQIYVQQPYTEYDKQNGIEKASVELAGYVKTDTIQSGETQTVKVSVAKSSLVSYDSSGNGAYLLEKNDNYYICAATDAHTAVNNILAAKGYTTSNTNGRMDANGNESLVENIQVEEDDNTTYSTVSGGETVSNKFSDATLDDAVYLSRSNWTAMDNNGLTYASGSKDGVSNTTNAAGTVGTAVVSDKNQAALTATGWDASGNPNSIDSYPEITTGEDNDLVLADMIGLDYDDEQWELLLNQLDVTTMHNLYKTGAYSTIEISSIQKPVTSERDGPEGLNITTGPAQVTIGATWNEELAEEYGSINGSIGILCGINGWYAPGANIHRTPFSGRNYEYVSEDSYLTGAICSAITEGAQSKGLNVVMKHFALNEQETNRDANGGVATYCSEQAIRQIYLQPFKTAITEHGAMGVMLSMNRIGNYRNRANYNLVTGVLYGEWGFKGLSITDYNVISNTDDSLACVSAGTNLQLYGAGNPVTESALMTTGAAYMLREGTHHILYFVANSLALNGYTHDTTYSAGVSVYVILLALIDLVIVALLVCGVLLKFFGYKLKNNDEAGAAAVKRHKILTIVYWGIVAALVVAALIVFFVYALPLLEQAFMIS